MKKYIYFLLSLVFSIGLLGSNSDSLKVDSTTALQIEKTIPVLDSEVFKNIHAKPSEGSVTINWALDYNQYSNLKDLDAKIFIAYITKIDYKRIKEGQKTAEGWQYLGPFPLSDVKHKIKDLAGKESYKYKIGISKKPTKIGQVKNSVDIVWSETNSFKTKRTWGFTKLLILLGCLGLFIYGMKIMSDGIQQGAGAQLKKLLGSITSNRFKGILTGFGITGIVQSSSVTTVMTVSLVNAGLMTLRQSAGVMMGANVGTTLTGWLILLIGFKVNIADYAFMLLGFAVILLFAVKTKKYKSWAIALLGFCLLFIGLDALKGSVPKLDENSALVQFFINYKDEWYGTILFVLLGALVTIIIQSSSASMALTLTMVQFGYIPFDVACAMVLGENIGTTITAEIASLVANVHAKRSARVHSLFNIIGVSWVLLIFPFFLDMIGEVVSWVEGTEFDPKNPELANSGIALFHTLFNVSNVMLLVGFLPQIVRFAERGVKAKSSNDEEFKLDYISSGRIEQIPSVSVMEAQKETAKFGEMISRMNKFVRNYVLSNQNKEKNKLISKIESYEEITDRVELEISKYLSQVSKENIGSEASAQLVGLLNVSSNLERIGDVFYEISQNLVKREENKTVFTKSQEKDLLEILNKLQDGFDIMVNNLNVENKSIDLETAKQVNSKLISMAKGFKEKQFENIEITAETIQDALIYNNIIFLLEKVGDHVLEISKSLSRKQTD